MRTCSPLFPALLAEHKISESRTRASKHASCHPGKGQSAAQSRRDSAALSHKGSCSPPAMMKDGGTAFAVTGWEARLDRLSV
jgi:hypothetical protein